MSYCIYLDKERSGKFILYGAGHSSNGNDTLYATSFYKHHLICVFNERFGFKSRHPNLYQLIDLTEKGL